MELSAFSKFLPLKRSWKKTAKSLRRHHEVYLTTESSSTSDSKQAKFFARPAGSFFAGKNLFTDFVLQSFPLKLHRTLQTFSKLVGHENRLISHQFH